MPEKTVRIDAVYPTYIKGTDSDGRDRTFSPGNVDSRLKAGDTGKIADANDTHYRHGTVRKDDSAK